MSEPVPTRIRPEDFAGRAFPLGRLSHLAIDLGIVEWRLYAPKGVDSQTPHERDEFYVVISGTGRYGRAGETVDFKPGDLLFAAANEEHRFVDFTEDFAVWVLFFGAELPEGPVLDPRRFTG